jgi:hypothetical protein
MVSRADTPAACPPLGMVNVSISFVPSPFGERVGKAGPDLIRSPMKRCSHARFPRCEGHGPCAARCLIATVFGYENWNILSAKIEAAAAPASAERSPSLAGTQNDPTPPKILYCSFCGKSQHEVQKLIAGPEVFICDECVDLCTGIVEPDDDKELFRLMKGNEETGGRADPALFELARGTSTEELAHYVERGRKGVERNRLALQGIQRGLAIRDNEVSIGDDISALPR